MRPRAILFDLDETLVNDDEASEAAWREAIKVSAVKLGLPDDAELQRHVKSSRREFWGKPENKVILGGMLFPARVKIVMNALGRLGVADEKVAREIVAAYVAAKPKYMVKTLDNVMPTLEALRGRSVKLALLTNGDSEGQRLKLRGCGLEEHFPVCLIAEELGYGKPDSRIFQLALDIMDVKPEQAWMVGDDLSSDVGGAQQAGLLAVWCDYAKKGLPEGSVVKPDRTIHDFGELLDMID